MVEENIWQLSLYNNVNASILFLPLIILSGEVQESDLPIPTTDAIAISY